MQTKTIAGEEPSQLHEMDAKISKSENFLLASLYLALYHRLRSSPNRFVFVLQMGMEIRQSVACRRYHELCT